ncbi:MAG: FHA domain-containing protein [Chloroflexota bacterium]
MADLPEGTPVLIALTPKLGGSRWPLEKDVFLIGRGADCDLVVAERQVSRHHARLRRVATGFVVEDLGSRNGTHVNGAPVADAVPLQDGDVIQIALALELAYVGTEATVPLAEGLGRGLEAGRLHMDPQAHRVWAGGVEIDPPLSAPQYRLLELLLENQDRVVTREQIIEYVWPGTKGVGVSMQAIDALVRRLRDRLAVADPGEEYIVTVRGHGFRLHNPRRR